MGYLRNTLTRVRSVLISMPPSQRYTVAALMALVAVALFMLLTSKPAAQYVKVLEDLSPEQMSTMQVALSKSGIRYQFASGMLMVEPKERDRVVMVLSDASALPSNFRDSFGLEEMAEPGGFSLETADQQKMRYNIALGNTLSRFIATAPEVKDARVTIGVAQSGYFEPPKATAAVFVKPRPGAQLSQAKALAICRLVAAAVGPTLDAAAVEVVDLDNGRTYSIESDGTPYAQASNHIELAKAWNSLYSRELERFLAPIFGRIQTLVTVRFETATKSMQTTVNAVVEETSRTETSTYPSPPGGETITKPNMSMSAVNSGAGAPGPTTESAEKEKKYAPAEVTTTAQPPGELQEVLLTVVVPLDALEKNIRAKNGMKPEDAIDKARVEAECASWQATIMNALPAPEDAKRVSTVRFSAEPFAEPQLAAALSLPDMPATGRLLTFAGANWQRMVLAVLAVIALLMVRSVARHAPDTARQVAGIEQAAAEDEVLLPDVEIDVDQKRAAKIRETIEDMIRRDPQSAVSLIRRWMARES
jgi:flagellar biosynthesis/type III secretory pathway M-ring protein FliF/YscJ